MARFLPQWLMDYGPYLLVTVVPLILGLDTARRWTVTHDEFWHIPAGLAYWHGRVDADILNPPLARGWCALPLWLAGTPLGEATQGADATGIGQTFLAANRATYVQQVAFARSFNLLLSLVTGITLVWIAHRWWGLRAAWTTSLVWGMNPHVLAAACVVTTDLAAGTAFVAVFLASRRAARSGWVLDAAWLGLALGIAQLCKYTCVLVYPLALAWWWLARWEVAAATVPTDQSHSASTATAATPQLASASGKPVRWQRQGLLLAAALALSVLVLDAGYLFQGLGTRLVDLPVTSRSLTGQRDSLPWLAQIPLPVPAAWVRGLDAQRAIMEGQHPVYLDGSWSTEGYWNYYIKAAAYKATHGGLFLFLCGSVALCVRRQRLRLLGLWLPILLLYLVASQSGMQLGWRYVFPTLPFCVWIAGAAGSEWVPWTGWSPRLRQWTLIAISIAALSLPLNLRHHPHHLSYFNDLSGGPENGRWLLVDSNLDWGQDLALVPGWLEQHPDWIRDGYYLAYFGTFPPSALGLHYQLPPREIPVPGRYIVSANFVQGRPHAVQREDGSMDLISPLDLWYLQMLPPTARVSPSILVFEITVDDIIRLQKAAQQDGLGL